MGYHDDDRYGGGNRWRDRGEGRPGERGQWNRDRDERGGGEPWNEGGRERAGWGSGWTGGGRGGRHGGRDGDDRGFFERAGEEVRSWFGGGDDDHRGRGRDPRWEHERGGRHQEHDGGSYGWMSGGWGNQAGESWNRDRPGVRGGWDDRRSESWERERPSEREGWFTASQGGERGRRWGGAEGARESGAHAQRQPGGDIHDPHYSEWRRRQIEELDRDYDEYRREHQSKFEQEFGGWRQKRQTQRQMLGKVTEHMDVVGSDGGHVGKVDKVRGDRIILAKSDPNAGGMHHSVPCGWVESVEGQVILNRSAEQAMASWRNEDTGRALFEREDQGSEGPHALDRSFSGTYGSRNDD